jgi:hypothetical protein
MDTLRWTRGETTGNLSKDKKESSKERKELCVNSETHIGVGGVIFLLVYM